MDKLKLKPDQLSNTCDPNSFEFKTTEELAPIRGIIGQERAKKSLQFGLGVTKKGYNIYVSGQWGTGRNSFVNMLTEEQAIKRPAPSDYLYVNNFKDPYHPIAIEVNHGQGKNVIKQVELAIRFLRRGIIEIFSSRDYENAKQKLIDEYNMQSNSIVDKLNDLGQKYGFMFSLTEKGIISIPLKDGKPLNEESYKNISQKDYELLMANSQKLGLETIDLFNKLRIEEEGLRNRLKSLEDRKSVV